MVRSLESPAQASRHSLGPRATCGVLSVIATADLLAFRLDQQTARGDATGVEARDRARGRLAQASRAEISEWEIDGRFHRIPFSEAIYMVHVESTAPFGARLSQTTCQTPRSRRGSHIKRKSRHDALTRRAVYGRGGTSAQRAACREHRDATPRARTLASTDLLVKYISHTQSRRSLGH